MDDGLFIRRWECRDYLHFKCLSDKSRLFLFSFHLQLKRPVHRRSGYEGAPVIALSASFQPALSHFL